MLRKILKYDFASVWRIWWILALGVFGLSVAGAFSLRFLITMSMSNDQYYFSVIELLATLFVIFCFLGIVASVIVTWILVFLRFYRHFYTDEGYLTFTLPVSRRILFLSKTLNAIIWGALQVVLMLVCALLFMTFSPPAEGGAFINPIVFKSIGRLISGIWENIGAWFIVYVIEAILITVITSVFSVSLIHFCITVGSVVAKKAKILASIGIYYLTNMVISFALQVLMLLGVTDLFNGFTNIVIDMPINEACCAVSLLVLIICLAAAVFTCLIYFITQGFIDRKLNLA